MEQLGYLLAPGRTRLRGAALGSPPSLDTLMDATQALARLGPILTTGLFACQRAMGRCELRLLLLARLI